MVEFRMVDWIDWLPKDLYRVGDDGSVWRRLKDGSWSRVKGDCRGYVHFKYDGHHAQASIGAVVLRAFVGPRPIGFHAFRYPDRSRNNNRLANLRWAPRGSWLVGVLSNPKLTEIARKHVKATRPLSDTDIASIFAYAREGWTQRELAEQFGVTQAAISAILCGRTYADVECDRTYSGKRTGDRHGRAKLTAVDIPEIRSLVKQGRSISSLSREYGVSFSAIRDAATGHTWRDV